MEDVVSLVVASFFFVTGMIALVSPLSIRNLRSRPNEKYALFYKRNDRFDGNVRLANFLYRLGGGGLVIVGICMFWAFLRP